MSQHDGYTLLCGTKEALPPFPEAGGGPPPLRPFDERVLAFLEALSAALMKDPAAKPYPDVATFGFFCRRGNLERLRGQYAGEENRLGRGLAFHIAPSNVPINFAYSLAAALLAGNRCIVKASSQDFPQTRLVSAAMAALLAPGSAHAPLLPYVTVLTYPRDRQDLTQRFSAQCDVRILWGGDETIARIRQAPLPPQSFDVTFADRYSLLAVSAKAVAAMDEPQLQAMAQGFFNDTYLTDQNACTSPRLVYWLADQPEERGVSDAAALAAAQTAFWQAVHAYAQSRYTLQSVVAVDKLTCLYEAAMTVPGSRRVPMADNLVTRIAAGALSPAVEALRCPGGCFVEYAAPSLEPLAGFVQRKVQTLTYLGIDPKELQAFVLTRGLRGIDRIVPLGHSMDFSLTWDGYDLIRTLSRLVQAL